MHEKRVCKDAAALREGAVLSECDCRHTLELVNVAIE
jgi:hypothetical protein